MANNFLTTNYYIVTWMAQREVGVTWTLRSASDVTYPHPFHYHAMLGKHPSPKCSIFGYVTLQITSHLIWYGKLISHSLHTYTIHNYTISYTAIGSVPITSSAIVTSRLQVSSAAAIFQLSCLMHWTPLPLADNTENSLYFFVVFNDRLHRNGRGTDSIVSQ